MMTYADRVVEVPVERVVYNEVVKYVDKIVEVSGTEFTCITGTKVQILTLEYMEVERVVINEVVKYVDKIVFQVFRHLHLLVPELDILVRKVENIYILHIYIYIIYICIYICIILYICILYICTLYIYIYYVYYII